MEAHGVYARLSKRKSILIATHALWTVSSQAHKAFVSAALASPTIATMHNPAYEAPASKNVQQFTFDRRDSTC